EIAEDRGFTVDVEGFDAAMAEQRRRAREAGQRIGVTADDETAAFQAVLDEHGTTEFTGREEYQSKATVLAVVPVSDRDSDQVSIFWDRTPFYAESGGQVGDTGMITTETGRAEVFDTTSALPGLHRHHARITSGEVREGQDAVATIDGERRDAIR